MKIAMTEFDSLTDEKAKFVEEQANRMLAFLMESRSGLVREAHTTINWLFGMILGSCGYIATLLNTNDAVKWWIVVTLFVVAAVAVWQSVCLFHYALRAVEVLPSGNEPKNLLTDDLMSHEMRWIRAAEACQLQERIELALRHNVKVATAVNGARLSVAVIPAVCVLASVVVILTGWSVA